MQRETFNPAKGIIIPQSISILSLYAEGDGIFLVDVKALDKISILSLYAEGDSRPGFRNRPLFPYFNPLPLCRGRHCTTINQFKSFIKFQSSPSMQRETYKF